VKKLLSALAATGLLFAAWQSFAGNSLIPLTGGGGSGPVVGGGGVTFDPAKALNITFSNGNLTVTNTSGSPAFGNTRSTTSHSSGKYYAEFTIVADDDASSMGVGLVNGTFAFPNSPNGLGLDNNAIAEYDNIAGNYTVQGYFLNSVQTNAFIGNMTPTHIVGMAVDVDNAKIWWRLDNGNWNGNASANPATNAFGVSITALGTPLFIAAEVETSGEKFTANFAGSFSFSAPAGFGTW
jgi:hypothetical protein